MVRNTLAVIASYIVMVVIVVAGLSGAYIAMGADRAYQPGTYDVSTLWLVTMVAVSIIAALIGGVCVALVSNRSKGARLALCIVIGVLGALSLAMQAAAPEPSPEDLVRTADVSTFDAANKAQTPLWVALLNPIIGISGVIIGFNFTKPKHAAAE